MTGSHGLRDNASTMSHAELDESEELDAGDPAQLALDVHELRRSLPALSIIGGCCGTDARHVAAMWGVCRRSRVPMLTIHATPNLSMTMPNSSAPAASRAAP